jgi:hypothetical protein
MMEAVCTSGTLAPEPKYCMVQQPRSLISNNKSFSIITTHLGTGVEPTSEKLYNQMYLRQWTMPNIIAI